MYIYIWNVLQLRLKGHGVYTSQQNTLDQMIMIYCMPCKTDMFISLCNHLASTIVEHWWMNTSTNIQPPRTDSYCMFLYCTTSVLSYNRAHIHTWTSQKHKATQVYSHDVEGFIFSVALLSHCCCCWVHCCWVHCCWFQVDINVILIKQYQCFGA